MITIFINLSAAIALLVSVYLNKHKFKNGIKKALMKALDLGPFMLIIIATIGLIFSFLPPDLIKEYLGGNFNIIQVGSAALFGAVMMIPSMIALPLVGSLIDAGASYTTVAAFVTTLTMVGFVTLPIELKELGTKITILRNVLAFIFAVFISCLIGVII
ncbi:MAG: permease [Halanaerobiales bacterium]